jgi:hypothetical protein
VHLRGIPIDGSTDGRAYRVVDCHEDASGPRLRLQLA